VTVRQVGAAYIFRVDVPQKLTLIRFSAAANQSSVANITLPPFCKGDKWPVRDLAVLSARYPQAIGCPSICPRNLVRVYESGNTETLTLVRRLV
jgi:hypothetical protein